jgi:hypothetical protein
VIDPLSNAAFAEAFDLQQNPEVADRRLHVHFYTDEVLDERATNGWTETVDGKEVRHQGAGRPIYKSVEMCEIHYGDKDNIVIDRVKSMHPDPRSRFPQQYARFKAGDKVQIVGTLLRKWGVIDPAEAKSYEAVNIHTVEQLAGLSDSTCQQYRGSLAHRQMARDWLATAAGHAPTAEARAENQKLREEIQALRDAIAEMKGGDVSEPKKIGRPRRPAAQEEQGRDG